MIKAENRKYNEIFITKQQYSSSKILFVGLTGELVMRIVIVWPENRKLTGWHRK